MKLQGQAKEDFEKWFLFRETYKSGEFVTIHEFESLPKSFQYGVYVDWFDSVGIYINKLCPDSFEIKHGWDIEEDYSKVDRTRQEARTAAIEKAVEIYNLKYTK